MPAIYEDPDGTIRYYIPPPPPPPPPKPKTGTAAPGFQHAVTVAKQATTTYFSGHSSETEKTKVLNDWASVGAIIADQYRVAWTSANPKAAVAALDRQYGEYFQNNGRETTIYNSVVSSAKGQVQGETGGQRQAEAKYYQDEGEPAGSKKTADLENDAIAITKADIAAELQTKFGKGNNGVYTADQIQAAANALDNLDNSASPLVDYVATDMEEGRTLSDVLTVLQTKGLKLTPAEIKSGSLGTIKLTPAETKSGTLILTPAEAQIAAKDPVTIAFLKADGITVTQLSPQMAQLAQQNPVLFSLMEINKVNISIPTGGDAVPASDLYSVPTGGNVGPTLPHTVYKLSNGSVLDITIDGKPYDPPTGTSSAQIVSIYEGAEATKKGTGVAALANMLLPQLSVNGTTLSNPSTTQLANLASLMTDADGARSQYASGQLASLLAAAPAAGSKDAAGYVAGTINPFLTTQLNGFFTPQGRSTFWSTSPAIAPLQTYLKTGIAAQFQPGNASSLNMAGVFLSKVLAGASPEEAKMLIGLVEGQVNSVSPSKQGSYMTPDTALLNALGQAAQLVDGLPLGGTQPNPGAEANQIAKWLLSTTERGVPVLGQWVADDFYYNITTTGDTDLPEALIDAWSTSGKYVYGTNGATPIELGNVINWTNDAEGTYDSALEKKLGAEGYQAFENNKAQTLNTFYTEYAKAPGINVKISKSDTNALQTAIIKAYGFTSSGMTPAQKNIVKIDMSWIANQSDPGSTVTILPFIFASSTMGMQTGVFFDISNPGNTNNPQQKPHPTQVLIDGSAAQYALQADGDAAQHPESVDVKWHYSSYQDFQLNNELYQNGTIYTLPNNPLGIKSDGSASSTTDFHKEFDTVMDDVAGGAAIVGGIALLPFTDGGSMVLTGIGLGLTVGSLGWGTYQAVSQYNDYTSHGEQFTLSNPNTRWAIVGDTMLAANWATLGFGGVAGGFTRAAERISQTADTLTYVSDRVAMSAAEETGAEDLSVAATDVSPEDVIPETDGVPSAATDGEAGNPVPASLSDVLSQLKAMETVNSQFATGFNWLKKGSEVIGYGLGGVQTVVSTYSTVTNWDKMSWGQRGMGILNIGEGVLPFFMEPIAEGVAEFAKNRSSESNKENTPPAFDLKTPSGSWRLWNGTPRWTADAGSEQATLADIPASPDATLPAAARGSVPDGNDDEDIPTLPIRRNRVRPDLEPIRSVFGRTNLDGVDPATAAIISRRDAALHRGFIVDSNGETEVAGPGAASMSLSRAAIVEGSVVDKWGNYIPADVTSIAKRTLLLGDADSEQYAQREGFDPTPDGFQKTYNNNRDLAYIAVAADKADPALLTHEVLHYYTSPAFSQTGWMLMIDPSNPHSNLREGATELLSSQLTPDAVRAYPQETEVARNIFEAIGADTFYRAYFQGDQDAIDAFQNAALTVPGVSIRQGDAYRETGPEDGMSPPAAAAPSTPTGGPAVSPAVSSGDRVYPVDLWPVADAMIFQGDFQGSSTVHLYAVPVDPSQRGQPLTFQTSDIAAHASVAWDDLDVKWNDASTGNPIGQFGKTVNQRFAKLTASLPEGKVWAVVASNSNIGDVKAGNGLTDVNWVLDRQQIPGQSGTAYVPPGYGTHGDGFLGLSDKYHLGVRSHGLVQFVVSTDKMIHRSFGYVLRDDQGWVKKSTPATDGRYISRTVVASTGTPIPVVDPASGRDLWLDAHNHAGTFIHPVYIRPEPYVDRIKMAEGTPGVADVHPTAKGGPLPGIVITLEHIPYLVQRGARWGNYTDQDVGSTTQEYAHLDDWKLLRQVETIDPPSYRDAVIPSITGLQAWREKGYGSNIVTKEYIEHLLLYFHPTDLSPDAENRAAYPISGENTLYAKEVYSLLAGRGRQTSTPLLPDVFGPEVATDLATILNTYEVLRDAGIVTVTHKDSSFAQFASDGRPVGAPGDDRYFFKEMMLDMALGPYDVSGLRFGDPDFVLSDSDINNILGQGGVKRPLASIVAHFQLGNLTRASGQHFDLVNEALNHPLMPNLHYDTSWLPSIEAQLKEQRSGQPLWTRRSPGAPPTFNGAYLDVIRSGKAFFGTDDVNAQTPQQQFAPWFAQMPSLRAIENDFVPGTSDSLLAHYAGGGFMKLYQDSKPAMDWFRYRAYKGISYDKASGDVKYDQRNEAYIAGWKNEGRQETLAAWAKHYEAEHPELANPDRVRAYLAKDQVPGQDAPSDTYPATSFVRGATTLNNSPVEQETRSTFNLSAGETAPWDKARLEAFRFPADGSPLHPEAIKVGTEAANTGFPATLQLATVAATHTVATAQADIKTELEESGNRSDRRNWWGIGTTLGALGTVAGTGPLWLPEITSHLGDVFPVAIGGAVIVRGMVNVLSSLSKTVNRKITELGAEEAAMDPDTADFMRRRFVRVASDMGLDPSRVTGEGGLDDVWRDYQTNIVHLLKTPLDESNGDTNDVRRYVMAWVQGYIPSESGRTMGTEATTLEETNPRSTFGQISAGVASVAYTLGAAKALSSIVADPAAIYDYFIAAGTGISAAYQAVGAVSGHNRTAWQELKVWTRLQSIFGNATSSAGIGGLGVDQAADAFSQGSLLAGTEAGFAGFAAISLARISWAAIRAEVTKLPPQMFDPPSDKYPLTLKGQWNKMLPGEPGQMGAGLPRQIPKLTIYAGLGLMAVGITTVLEALQKQGGQSLAITPNVGTVAYPTPGATGTPAGVFNHNTSVKLTGKANIDDNGKIWVQVTGVAVGGQSVTAWVEVNDLDYNPTVTEPANLYSKASSSSHSLINLPKDTSLVATGDVQEDASGNLWIQVTASEGGRKLTGWVEVTKVSSGALPSPSATLSPSPIQPSTLTPTQSPTPTPTRTREFAR